MDKIRVGINGFGRIGRTFLRAVIDHPTIQVVAINDLAPIQTMAHLLQYDSIHGRFQGHISSADGELHVNNTKIVFTHHRSITDITWPDVDIVIEATGKFKEKQLLEQHINSGSKQVILSAPPIDDRIKTVVLGVNDHILTPQDTIISNASCTTNNAAPLIKVLDELCGIEQAYITTVHSYTTDQSLHDQPHRDLRRARAAAQSIVPTTTGAAKALTKIFPHLSNVIGGCGIRVPVPNGSLTDMTINVKRNTSIQEINQAFIDYSKTHPQILSYNIDPIVSVDIIGSPFSCVLDSEMTSVIGKMVKLIGWYDNEMGYSNRLVDLIELVQSLKKN